MDTHLVKFILLLSIFGVSLASNTCEFSDNRQKILCENIVGNFPQMRYGFTANSLKCNYCIIRTFSESTFPYENSLTTFNVSESGIEHIMENAFSKLRHVQFIGLQSNRINSISPGAFAGLGAIRELNLAHNRLEHLAPGTFENLDVAYVILRQNRLAEVTNRTFHGIKSIRYLDLSKNKISTLSWDSFSALDSLITLDLSANNLCNIPLGVFRNLGALKNLHLTDNKLTRFSTGSFSGLWVLKNLYLDNNAIELFDGDMLITLQQLDSLDISRNKIYYFDAHNIHMNAPSLRNIKMTGNTFSCNVLKNIVQYFRKAGVSLYVPDGRYDVQNIDGIVCIDVPIIEAIPFSKFLDFAKNEARNFNAYC